VVGEYEQQAEQGAEGTAQADPDGRLGRRVGQQAGQAGGIAGEAGADVGIVGEPFQEGVLVALECEEQLALAECDVEDLRKCPLPGGVRAAAEDWLTEGLRGREQRVSRNCRMRHPCDTGRRITSRGVRLYRRATRCDAVGSHAGVTSRSSWTWTFSGVS
jgi:hypothetical protein